jgi:TonB family protein
MFTSAATHKHDWRASERRSCHRKPLQWAVLVFFGDNWGKLIDLSERGMSLQFAHAPSMEAPIHFTFEAMGCMPLPQDAKIFGDSIQATGQVVWSLEFERTAGVKFLELSPRSRDQIRYWISSAPSQQAARPSEVAHKDPPQENQELDDEWAKEWNKEAVQEAALPSVTPETPASPVKSFSEPFVEEPESNLEDLDSESKGHWESEPAFPAKWSDQLEPNPQAPLRSKSAFASLGHEPATSSPQSHAEREPETEPLFPPRRGPQTSEMEDRWQPKSEPAATGLDPLDLDSQAFLGREDRQRRGQTLELKQRRTRLGFTAVLAGLVTVAAVAGIIGFVSKFIGGAEVAGSASHPLASQVDSNRADDHVAAENASPFLVEVLDANNRRSVLFFSDEAHGTASASPAPKSVFPAASADPRGVAPEVKATTEAKREASHDFILVPPHSGGSGNTSAASSTAIAAPALEEALPSPDTLLPGTLPSPSVPTPVEPEVRQGGEVQPARLIRARLPDYPQLARTNHAAGDVTLDALVDASGNVRDVKVISGPVLLRAAAIAALLQWKYEPARLDGQPTPMHLTVTMKFKDALNKQ